VKRSPCGKKKSPDRAELKLRDASEENAAEALVAALKMPCVLGSSAGMSSTIGRLGPVSVRGRAVSYHVIWK